MERQKMKLNKELTGERGLTQQKAELQADILLARFLCGGHSVN